MYDRTDANPVWRATAKERKRFLDSLKIAIDVAGGCGDDRWDDRSLDHVFSSLLTNGIEITFKITKDFPEERKRQYYETYKEFREYVKKGGSDNVLLFLLLKKQKEVLKRRKDE